MTTRYEAFLFVDALSEEEIEELATTLKGQMVQVYWKHPASSMGYWHDKVFNGEQALCREALVEYLVE